MTYEPILPSYIDSTMLSCFRLCPKRFYWEFVLGLRPSEISIDLHAGAAFSAALERFYREYWEGDRDIQRALSRTLPSFLSTWGDFSPSKPTPKTRDNLWQALNDYIERWPPATDHVQPFDLAGRKTVEFSFSIPLDYPGFPRHPVTGDPFVYCGRCDLLGLYNNRNCVRDEKTTARLESNWPQKWGLRGQFLGYCWGVSASGIPCDTVVVRGIVLHSKSPNILVESIQLYGQWELERWFDQLRIDLHRLVECWKTKWFDLNLGDACTMYSGCSFVDLCKSPDPSRWFDTYSIKRWNPLDRNPIEPAQGV